MKQQVIVMAVSAALAGSAGAVLAQKAPSGTGSTRPAASTPNYPDSVARLKEASQRLRQSIQAMAQQPAGERRNKAIGEAQDALYDAQQAMVSLPPEVYTNPAGGAEPNHTKSMERLQQASDKLREAIQAMAERPAGKERNAAVRDAREALLETQQAMVWLPPDLRTGQTGSATGGSSSSTR